MRRHQRDIRELIIKMWPVFNNLGVPKAVKNCACLIDTDTRLPIVCRCVTHGPHEILIIKQAINSLLDSKQIRQVSNGE